LLVAIDSSHEAMARFLVEHGADVNQSGAGRTPLHSAVQQKMPDLVKLLLDHKANPNVRTTKPMPFLSRYIFAQTGMDVNPVGATPLWLAADYGDLRSMRYLADAGADPSIATVDQTTPLMAAAGIDFIEGQDRYGRRWFQESTMPLQLAALEALKLCVELGGDVNGANANGLTPMHGAAYMGSNLIAQYLFDHGAKLDARNRLGQTPYFITQGVYQAGTFITRKETGDLLKKLGADTSISADKSVEEKARQNSR
jgi:ankyrin